MSIPTSILKSPVVAPGASQGLSRADKESLINEVGKAVRNNITVELKGKAARMFDIFVHDASERGRLIKDRLVSK